MYQNFPPCISHSARDSYLDSSDPCMNSIYNRVSCNNNEMPQNMGFARAYIPRQPYSELLPLNVALKRGSVFSNINLNYPRP